MLDALCHRLDARGCGWASAGALSAAAVLTDEADALDG
jgi:hypothetical protein